MMKRTIQQLISALSTLTSPFNPVDIKKIFDKHPPLDITQIPTELKKYAEQLLALNNLTNQSFELANQRHSLSIEQERLVQLAQVDDLTHRSIHTLQEQLRESCELVNNSFQLLMPLINANLLKQNKLNSPYTATVDSKTQQLAVEEYHDQLSRSLNEIETRAATLTFFQTTKTINDLVEELKTFGINLSAKDGKEHIQNLISSITLHLSQLKGIKPRAIELHQLFAKQLSAIELQAKIKELDQQLVTIEEQLENVRLEIAINTLDTKIKEQLSEEFLKSPNKSELIKIYHDKLPGPLSYVDPYSWKSWIHDHHRYELAQLETQNSVSYLQLLEKKYVLKLEKTRLNTQKRTLSVLMPVTQNSSEGGLAMSILVEQARILLRECGLLTTPITTPPNASASDFYLALLSSIPIVEQKSERMIIVLTGLQKLLSLDAEINQLRMRYKLDTNGDLKPANQKGLEQLVQSVESQQTIKEDLMQQLEMCQSFLARMAKLDEIEKELQAIIIRKKSMELTLGMARHEIPIPTQLHTLSGQLSVLRLEVENTMEKIRMLPLLREKPEELPTSLLKVSSLETPSAPRSLNPNHSSLANQDAFSKPLFREDKQSSTISVDEKQEQPTVLPEQFSLERSTSSVEPPTNQISATTLLTEVLADEQAKTFTQHLELEHHLMDEHVSPGKHSVSSGQIIPISEQLISFLKIQKGFISPPSNDLNAEQSDTIESERIEEKQKTMLMRESSEEQQTSPLTGTLLSKQPLGTGELRDEHWLGSPLPIDLKSDQILILGQVHQDRSEEQLGVTGTGEVRSEQLITTAPVDSLQSKLSIPTPEKSVLQLTSMDKIALLPAQKVNEEPSVRMIPTSLMPNQSSAHKQGKPKKLMSSEKMYDEHFPPPHPDAIARTVVIPPPNESQKRQHWYQRSLAVLKHQPIEIQQWCMDVYKAVETYSTEDNSYKESHLIRDILFELQFRKDLDVIKAYMRLCPVPEKDLNKLLLLKPDLPLVGEPFDETIELQATPAELKPLYAQYRKLKNEHPIEGELLLQAIHSLHMAKIFIATPHSNISGTQIPSLSKDPRYEPLKRHRGFFKVWEAIEDFCRMLIGKIMGQAEFEYSKRPCFFRTKSTQLVEEADLRIQRDLLTINAI